MRSTHRRFFRYGTVAALTLLGGGAGLSTASASAVSVDPAPIGAHQFFVGQVNGTSANPVNPVIKVVCPGPATGQSGHPVAGQSVAVLPGASSTSADVGYTGESATSVHVEFAGPTTTGAVVLTRYAVAAAIPTTLLLPCSGTGTVAFVPSPTSPTAQTALVKVTYVNIAV